MCLFELGVGCGSCVDVEWRSSHDSVSADDLSRSDGEDFSLSRVRAGDWDMVEGAVWRRDPL
jgi:hypothetical protein